MEKVPSSMMTAMGPEPGLQSRFLSGLQRVLTELFVRYAHRLNRVLPTDGSEAMVGPLELMEYTDAPDTKPTAADYEGTVIYVSDGVAGAKFRGSDGTSWINLG